MLDTVGIIGELQDMLNYSYKNTLDEICLADVLVHVRDISHPESEFQKQNVMNILNRQYLNRQLFESHHIEVWNKTDLVDKQVLKNKLGDARSTGTIMSTSLLTDQGVQEITSKIDSLLKDWKPQGQ